VLERGRASFIYHGLCVDASTSTAALTAQSSDPTPNTCHHCIAPDACFTPFPDSVSSCCAPMQVGSPACVGAGPRGTTS